MLWLIVLNVVVTALVLAVAGLIFYKVRKIHLATYDLADKIGDVHHESKWLYAQIQALVVLQVVVNLYTAAIGKVLL